MSAAKTRDPKTRAQEFGRRAVDVLNKTIAGNRKLVPTLHSRQQQEETKFKRRMESSSLFICVPIVAATAQRLRWRLPFGKRNAPSSAVGIDASCASNSDWLSRPYAVYGIASADGPAVWDDRCTIKRSTGTNTTGNLWFVRRTPSITVHATPLTTWWTTHHNLPRSPAPVRRPGPSFQIGQPLPSSNLVGLGSALRWVCMALNASGRRLLELVRFTLLTYIAVI